MSLAFNSSQVSARKRIPATNTHIININRRVSSGEDVCACVVTLLTNSRTYVVSVVSSIVYVYVLLVVLAAADSELALVFFPWSAYREKTVVISLCLLISASGVAQWYSCVGSIPVHVHTILY